jgi:hypothetical protein
MYQSVIQRVGSIPELLDLIFDYLDPPSNANNAVVCKVWSEVARDQLWREVRDPRQLLSILAPISTSTGVCDVIVMHGYPELLIILFRASKGNSSRGIGLAL